MKHKLLGETITDLSLLGKQQCLKVWCDELELPYKAVYHRFKYKNQTDPKILFRPIRRKQCVL